MEENPMSEIKYSSDHEWARLEEGNTAVIGITDFARNSSGISCLLNCPMWAIVSRPGMKLP